jgi:hypothetical protein
MANGGKILGLETTKKNSYRIIIVLFIYFLYSSMCYGLTVLVRFFSLFAFNEQMWLFRKQVAYTLNSAHTVTHSLSFLSRSINELTGQLFALVRLFIG